ncbi:MAG TPA: ATP-binding cassette domain-containing protein, partial [Chthoniobacterales bacterium]
MSSEPTIELVDLYKSFGSTRVLEGVSLPLFPGEVHSLMGENGAGKSTLVKVMAGLHLADQGTVRIQGEPVLLRSPSQAQQLGVSVIYQEPTLFGDLSVAENVFMHRQPKTSYGWIDYAEMKRAVAQHLGELGVSLRPEDPVLGLSIADQQIVEIIKALTFEAKALIMDEPTAA